MKILSSLLVASLAGCGAIEGGAPPDPGEIVLAANAAPPGMAFNGTGEGHDALTVVVLSGRQAEFLALPGFAVGHYRTFSGDAGAVLSLALVFDDAEDAATAYDLYLDELQSGEGYGLDDAQAADWGDEGVCASGPVPTPIGEETICLWQADSVVMALGGAMDPDQFEDIAAGMDRRAAGGG